jgi:hypothetical protein
MASIVGTWNSFVDWLGSGPIASNPLTFNEDGTWTYPFGGGTWVGVQGMLFFSFTDRSDLVYAANVNTDVLSGIMGYLGDDNLVTGVWWATRPGAPQAAIASKATPETDLLVGPLHK